MSSWLLSSPPIRSLALLLNDGRAAVGAEPREPRLPAGAGGAGAVDRQQRGRVGRRGCGGRCPRRCWCRWATRSVARLRNATNLPSPLIELLCDSALPDHAGRVLTLTSVVVPAAMLRTNVSRRALASLATRLVASLRKLTKLPSSLTCGSNDCWSPGVPVGAAGDADEHDRRRRRSWFMSRTNTSLAPLSSVTPRLPAKLVKATKRPSALMFGSPDPPPGNPPPVIARWLTSSRAPVAML